jgi:hypothetical protein
MAVEFEIEQLLKSRIACGTGPFSPCPGVGQRAVVLDQPSSVSQVRFSPSNSA